MNDENLRLTGTANTPAAAVSGSTGTTLVETAVLYGKNRAGIAELRVAGTISALSSAQLGITLQQATTLAAASTLWFDIAVFPGIKAVGGSTNNPSGANQTGMHAGIETSGMAAKVEIPGVGPLAVEFLCTMDYLRVKKVTTNASAAAPYNFAGVSVEVRPTNTAFKRSGES